MKILVTGSYGQLGSGIRMLTEKKGFQHNVFFADVDTLDVTDLNAVNAFFEDNEVDVVINCAAYTNVDKAESDEELAYKINATGVENLAINAKKKDAFFVHISTDYVFDGSNTSPYLDTDPTNPIGVYGKTKLDGENKLREIMDRSIIIRTSWVYSRFGKNFLKTMMWLGDNKEEINVVNDQIGCPTYAGDLAKSILDIIEQQDKIKDNVLVGFCNTGKCSWFDFASLIMEKMGSKCKVHPVPSTEFPTVAKRPAYSLLSNDKIIKEFNVVSPDWKDSVELVVKYFQENPEKRV